VRADGTTIRKFFSGALNGETFLKYIHEDLAPSLHPWDFVIMGDLRCHKVQGVKEAVKSAGAFVLYLPPYSPDFNPIEMMWSKIKAIFRKLKARTIEALFSAFPYAFHTVSTDDIRNWFIAAGYSQSYLELL